MSDPQRIEHVEVVEGKVLDVGDVGDPGRLTASGQRRHQQPAVQRQTNLAILFVTHDFGIVASLCDRVAVMYAGRIVELAPVADLFERPKHPYTEVLLRSVPDLETDVERLYSIEGQPPALDALPKGCSFAPRCPAARDICRERKPPRIEAGAGHRAECWKLTDYA